MRLGEQDGQPWQEEQGSRADPQDGLPPALKDGHEEKGGDQEERQVVGPQKQGGRERDQGDPAPARRLARGEQEEGQPQKSEQSIGSGLRGIEQEKRGRGRQQEEAAARGSPRQAPRAGKEEEKSEKGEEPRHAVGKAETLGRQDERLLQQIEEGRARVESAERARAATASVSKPRR